MLVKTNRYFFDTLEDKYRKPEDEFEVSKERFEELNAKIKGFVTAVDNKKENKKVDESEDLEDVEEIKDIDDDMTVAEIKALLDEKGIEYKAKASKDELKALLK